MNHVVTTQISVTSVCGGRGRVHGVAAARDNLVWLLECVETGALAVIDGPNAKGACQLAEDIEKTLTIVLNTHTHPDHIGVNKGLARAGLLDAMTVVGCADRAKDIPGLTTPVRDGDTVTVGNLRGRVIRGDGHIDGHISFLFDDALFCGDTLFGGGCGRPFDGPPERLFQSLLALASLNSDTKVFCAHEYTLPNLEFALTLEPDNVALVDRINHVRDHSGDCFVPSTIGLERATNPFLRTGSVQIREKLDAQKIGHAEVFCRMRTLKSAG